MQTYKKIEVFPEGVSIVDISSVKAIYPSGFEGHSIIYIGGDTRLVVKGIPDQVAADLGIEVDKEM